MPEPGRPLGAGAAVRSFRRRVAERNSFESGRVRRSTLAGDGVSAATLFPVPVDQAFRQRLGHGARPGVYLQLSVEAADVLVGGVESDSQLARDRRPQYAFDYTAARWANVPAEVALSRYRSPTEFTSVKRWDAAMFSRYPNSSAPLAQNGYPATSMSKFYVVNRYANLESRFFNGRVITLPGFLSNRSASQTRVYDPAGNFRWAGPAPISGAPNGFMRPKPSKSDRPSINTSFVISPDLTVYYNGQNTTQPGLTLGQIDGNGVPMAPFACANFPAPRRPFSSGCSPLTCSAHCQPERSPRASLAVAGYLTPPGVRRRGGSWTLRQSGRHWIFPNSGRPCQTQSTPGRRFAVIGEAVRGAEVPGGGRGGRETRVRATDAVGLAAGGRKGLSLTPRHGLAPVASL